MKRSKRFRDGGGSPLPYVDPLFAEALAGRGRLEPHVNRRRHHKTMQLCRQVQRALSLSLSGECDDDVLRSVYVEAVEPAPDASRVLVRLIVPRGIAPSQVLGRIERFRAKLRADVAAAITRKRAPELAFLPIAAGAELR
jgi:ribosome-binding factor A